MFTFSISKRYGKARLSTLCTPHGCISGPFFQFVATQAAIRGMVFTEDLERMGVQIVLANTYHLHLRPGEELIADAGGLHGFMHWNKPITTDSGGYQVFSLGKHVTIDEDGVTFRAPLDGSKQRFTPEHVMRIEEKLGADIIMPLDVCTPFGASKSDVASAIEKTTAWAQRCIAEHAFLQEHRETKQALYGIVQGGVYPELRKQHARELSKLDFFGYSIGGELREGSKKNIREIVPLTTPHLPEDKPRYLMGYGQPEDILEAVRAGVDHFDCVLPIRNARHGQLFYDLNEDELRACLQDSSRTIDPDALYTKIDITKSRFAKDQSVLSADHPVIQKPYTKAYVHHLMRAEVPSGMRLAVLHNIYFYVRFMKATRAVIASEGE